jgi:hypothetical protein
MTGFLPGVPFAAKRPETGGPSRIISRAQPDIFPATLVDTATMPARN